MKMVSKIALATILSLGVVMIGSAPADAQRSQKQGTAPAEPPLQLSPEFRKPAAAAQAALAAKDYATAETQLAAAEAIAKNDDERYLAAQLRLPLEAGKNSNDGMLKALDALLVNPKTPAAKVPTFNFAYGNILFVEKRYADAVPYLLKARAGGSTEKELPLMLGQAYFNINKLADGVVEMGRAVDAEKAAGRKPPEDWYKYTFAKVYNAQDRAGSTSWAMRWFAEYPTLANWRYTLVNYRNSVDKTAGPLTKKEKIELFRLMHASHALADSADYFDYGNAALQSGLPWEAIAIFDEGKTAGKIPAGDPQFAAVYTGAQTGVKSESPLETQAKAALAAPTGKESASTGDAFLASGNFARAVTLYEAAAQKGSIDPDLVNLHRGYALYQLGRKDEARQAFALVTKAPLSDVAHLWTLWIDTPAPAA